MQVLASTAQGHYLHGRPADCALYGELLVAALDAITALSITSPQSLSSAARAWQDPAPQPHTDPCSLTLAWLPQLLHGAQHTSTALPQATQAPHKPEHQEGQFPLTLQTAAVLAKLAQGRPSSSPGVLLQPPSTPLASTPTSSSVRTPYHGAGATPATQAYLSSSYHSTRTVMPSHLTHATYSPQSQHQHQTHSHQASSAGLLLSSCSPSLHKQQACNLQGVNNRVLRAGLQAVSLLSPDASGLGDASIQVRCDQCHSQVLAA